MTNAIRHLMLALVAAATLTALVTVPATAQPNADRLLAELRRTDEILMEARDVVTHALGPRPSNVLSLAAEMQDEAWSAFRNDSRVRAFSLTKEARRSAIRAVDITRSQLRLLDEVRVTLAANEDLVARIRDALTSAPNPEAERLMEAGLQQLSRGRRAFDDGLYRQAVRFALFGRDLLLRSLHAAQGDGRVDAARIETEIDRTEEFLREARLAVNDAPALDPMFDEARRLQDDARARLRDRQLEPARKLTLRARQRALDILRQEAGEPDADEVRAVIVRVTDRLTLLQAQLRESSDRNVEMLLERAASHVERGRRALQDGNPKQALAEAQLASSLLGQVESVRD